MIGRVARRVGLSAVLLLAAAWAAAGQTGAVPGASGPERRPAASRAAHGDVGLRDAYGATPLHQTVYRDDHDAVKRLIASGADVKAANRFGITPLWLACVNGNPAIVGTLLHAGADANLAMPEGDTILMTAARTGNEATVKLLLGRGADPNAREKTNGQTALMWAAAEGHAGVAQALIAAGADVHARSAGEGGFTAFLLAARGGHVGVARVLLAAGVDVNERLVNKGASNGASGLILAIASTHYEFAAFLLDQGADPNADQGWGWTALHQLEFTRRPPAGRHVIPFPVPAGSMDSLVLAGKLLAHGANPNARMSRQPLRPYFGRWANTHVGVTPFWLGAKFADVPFMQLMLEHGADPSIPNADGTTPLMAAAGVDMYETGYETGTPEEVLSAVRLCISAGNDVTSINANGDTALHGAAIRGQNDLVLALVEKGARLDVANKKIVRRGVTSEGIREGRDGGWTPWQVANGVYQNGRALEQPETAKLLARLMEERGIPVQ